MTLRFKIPIATLVFLLLSAGSYFIYIEAQGNFYPITDDEAYRSAQLDRDEFEYYIKEYDIKSIVNLLGKHPNESWYQEEMEVSADHNVRHYDLSLPATREPTEEDAQELVEIYKTAPRPVLVHCKAGADRSGLAAAMWKVIVDKEPKSEAAKELSILYGHIPIGKTIAMDHFFEKWNPALN